jgi:type I restriction enzyme S subunit
MKNNIKTTWRKVKLGELVIPGGSVSGPFGSDIKSIYFRPKGVPIIRGNNLTMNIDKGRYKDDDYIFLDPKKFEELKKAEALPEDIIITARGTIGQTGIIPRNSKYPRYIISANQLRFRIDKQKADPLFVYYQLSSKYMAQQMQNYSVNVGVPNFNLTAARNLELLIPEDINEQKPIADILSAFDDKIEVNNKIIKTLEEMAQEVFKEWFVRFRFSGWQKVKFVDSELEKIPEEWKVGYLGDGIYSEIIKPKVKKFEGEKIYLATADVEKNEIVNEKTKISYNNRPVRANMEPVLNSIWFAKMINTYKVLFFFEGNKEDIEKYILSTGFMGIKALKDMQYYLYLFINSIEFHQIKDTLVQGAVQEAITNTNVKQIQFLVPSETLLNEFNKKVEPLLIMAYKLKKENQKLTALRDLLLPKLMSGETRL